MERFISLSRTKGPFILGNYKRELVWNKSNWKCQKCGKRVHKFSLILDHIIPVKIGGPNVIWDKKNLWLLCRECNCEKLSKDRTIMNEMIKLGFFSKGTNWHTLFKLQEECVEYYKRRFKELY